MNPEERLKASKSKPQVRISPRMAQCMEEILRGDIDKPVKEVPTAMRAALGIGEGEQKEDFPPCCSSRERCTVSERKSGLNRSRNQ